jgi:hypothetical protein
MKNLVYLMIVVMLLSSVSYAHAQTGGPYELTQSVLGSGGTVSGGAYQIAATIGQPEASQISGGGYTLGSGFWGGGGGPASGGYQVYLPVVIR